MRGLPYYEEPEYHEYLLSRERRELFPLDKIIEQIRWKGLENFLDFGIGPGYFLAPFYKKLPKTAHLWGAECQELLIDRLLRVRVKEGLEQFSPFYVERTEHPLLPEWIPEMDAMFCCCVLSTFANPALAMHGIGRHLKPEATMIILDWEKKEAPSGPDINMKVSSDRMKYFIEDGGFVIKKTIEINPHIYGFEVAINPERREEFMNRPYLDY